MIRAQVEFAAVLRDVREFRFEGKLEPPDPAVRPGAGGDHGRALFAFADDAGEAIPRYSTVTCAPSRVFP